MAEVSNQGGAFKHPAVIAALIAGICGVLTTLITVGAFNGWFRGPPEATAQAPVHLPALLPPEPSQQQPDPSQTFSPPSQFPMLPPAVPQKGTY